ncbi:hypothetical protein F2Q70_00021484 [Brassica cretica]|uniref:Uncharacterized protein n=2 Tax=Brassica cretica TaxID=69181 RepID=A0A3N6RRZ1_BRACR|nr:hypothetical protein F2Q70_00021484 [Brassica cretica]KAF2554718.1 hypothetical protein F2Q68_00015034 [Brassica cretica]KAF3586755.1 hypothetical protein F2Q69_00028722 [Brassica cretica]KAF3606702.1 hypothetical protein DY000_02047771 [Brassica cretica]
MSFDSLYLVGVHEKVAACPRHKNEPFTKRSDSCDSLRILYHYSCVTTRDIYIYAITLIFVNISVLSGRLNPVDCKFVFIEEIFSVWLKYMDRDI